MSFTHKDLAVSYPNLRNYAFYLTNNNSNEAEDLLQDTLLKMLEKKELFSNKNSNYSVEKWGASIMHNMFTDKKRKESKNNKLIPIEDIKTSDVIKLSLDSFKHNERIEIRNKCRKIKSLLRKELNTKNKRNLECIILRGFGLSYKEIANHLEINVNTVKGRYFEMKNDLPKLINAE